MHESWNAGNKVVNIRQISPPPRSSCPPMTSAANSRRPLHGMSSSYSIAAGAHRSARADAVRGLGIMPENIYAEAFRYMSSADGAPESPATERQEKHRNCWRSPPPRLPGPGLPSIPCPPQQAGPSPSSDRYSQQAQIRVPNSAFNPTSHESHINSPRLRCSFTDHSVIRIARRRIIGTRNWLERVSRQGCCFLGTARFAGAGG